MGRRERQDDSREFSLGVALLRENSLGIFLVVCSYRKEIEL